MEKDSSGLQCCRQKDTLNNEEQCEQHLPWKNLVVSILKIPFLAFLDRICQLVLMEVEDLFQFAKVRAEGGEFSQVKHRACKKDPGKQGEQCLLPASELAGVTPSPAPHSLPSQEKHNPYRDTSIAKP